MWPVSRRCSPSRAAMLAALSDGRALPAGVLARCAGVPPQTASAHLARLLAGGLLIEERHGRHRYFRIAAPTVVRALEALAPLAAARPAGLAVPTALRFARTCYDHLAGAVGVKLAEALVQRGVLEMTPDGYAITPVGTQRLEAFGLDMVALGQTRRALAPRCLDWSERRYHLAGALGAALLTRLLALGWLRRAPTSRVVHLTATGRDALRHELDVDLA